MPSHTPSMPARHDAKLLVLDLDGTLARLDVDWAGLRARLEAEVRSNGLETASTGVVAVPQELRAAGQTVVAEACERLVARAELEAAGRAPYNAALIRWIDARLQTTPVAVLSTNSRAAVSQAVARTPLAWRKPPIVARESVTRLKPDPEGLVALIRSHRADAAGTLVIGDAEADHACALAAGARSIDISEIGLEWREPRRDGN